MTAIHCKDTFLRKCHGEFGNYFCIFNYVVKLIQDHASSVLLQKTYDIVFRKCPDESERIGIVQKFLDVLPD